MKWIKTPPELKAKFEAASPSDPRVVRKPMFGYPALYLNGNMFAGTFQDRIVIRLSEAGRAEAMRSVKATAFEPFAGHPMKEYVVLPRAVVDKPSALGSWIGKGRAYAATLPAKAAKAAAPTATKAEPKTAKRAAPKTAKKTTGRAR